MKVEKSSQLIVHAADQPGELAKVLKLLSDAGVNGRAFAGWAADGVGRIILVMDDHAKALSLLRDAGYEVREEPVALVTDRDSAGSGAAIAQKIADAGINLQTAFASAAGGEYLTVFQAEDVDALVEALK